MHVAGGPQLSHPCVHQRDSGLPFLPGSDELRVGLPPGEVIELGTEILRIELGEVKKDVVGELSPPHFGKKLCFVLVGICRKRPIELCPNLMGAEFAKSQVRAQPRGRDRAGLISSVIQPKGVLDKIVKPLVGTFFSRSPHLLESAGPIGPCWKQIPRFKVLGGHVPQGPHLRGGWQRSAGRFTREGCSPKRREHFERVTITGPNRPRLKQEIARKTFTGDAPASQIFFQLCVCFPGKTVAAVPEHCGGASLGDEVSDDVGAAAGAEHEGATDGLE